MFDDRRKYIRFDVPLNIRFKSPSVADSYTNAVTNNFSREGLGVLASDFSYDTNSTINMSVKHPFQDKYIDVLADVVWKSQKDNKWQVGLRIKEMDKAAKIENKWVRRGEPIVVVSGEPIDKAGISNKLVIHYVGEVGDAE